jgi:hypothetical protein
VFRLIDITDVWQRGDIDVELFRFGVFRATSATSATDLGTIICRRAFLTRARFNTTQPTCELTFIIHSVLSRFDIEATRPNYRPTVLLI